MARIEKLPSKKGVLHTRNRHQGQYNFPELIALLPELGQYLKPNFADVPSIDFGEPLAVKALNRALLMKFYQIEYWDIPPGYLCPPIPGRADYLHNAADLLAESSDGKLRLGPGVRVLDIGVGANCVYPIIGTAEYGWNFVGSECDPGAYASAKKIVVGNPRLQNCVELRFQTNPQNIFQGICKPGEFFHLSICNPPFHASAEQASEVNRRKSRNLGKASVTNFGGRNHELWCEGGEVAFITKMIEESKTLPKTCLWYTAFVSKEASLGEIYDGLRAAKVSVWRTIEMAQGQKKSRFVAWSFT